MNRGRYLKSLKFLAWCMMLAVGSWLAFQPRPLPAQEPQAQTPVASNPYFAQIFSEKVLTVTRESDGLLPGTLRTALIQASGIRNQNAFSLVRIVFDAGVKRIHVTNGPLPEVSGSLTTIDCQTTQGRVLIEGAQQDGEGVDPSVEIAGLKLSSNGNVVRNCHITGFRGPGILIRGNRNLLEYNTIGYHKAVPESAVDSSAVFEEPKTNQGAGVYISDGSSENSVQNNEIVANAANGVELSGGVGTGNKVTYNFFAKNSGRPIKVAPNTNATRQPQITKILQQGDLYMISGIAEANADLQIYVTGKEDNEIGMIVVPSAQLPHDTFTVATKSKGFIPNQTKIIALAHGQNRNTSEFSNPILIPTTGGTVIGTPENEGAPATAPAKPEATPGPADGNDNDTPQADGGATDANKNPVITTQAPAPKPTTESETTININGMGDKGHEPETGGMAEKNSKLSSLGI